MGQEGCVVKENGLRCGLTVPAMTRRMLHAW